MIRSIGTPIRLAARSTRTALLLAAAMAALAVPLAEARPSAGRVELRLAGAALRTLEICGARRVARVAGLGDRVVAVGRSRGRAARRRGRLTLRVRRCDGGRTWRRAAGRYRRPRRVPLPTGSAGDFRVQVTSAARSRAPRSRPVFLRVSDPIVDVPVRFAVRNVNRSRLSCVSDGAEYALAGRLVGPRSALRRDRPAVTLYLHEFSYGRYFWQFPVDRYDYAAHQARAGHVSVVVDRLGYDESSRPHGEATCLGAQADMAHQMVEQLRGGAYGSSELGPVRFERVALGGHSVGGAVAELEAYSFRDVDALALFGHADQNFESEATREAGEQALSCAAGGEPSEPGGPPGYAYFAQTEAEARRYGYTSAEPEIVDIAMALRNRDPCGDSRTVAPLMVSNSRSIGQIELPVLLLYGTSDWVYRQPAAGEEQRRLYSGSRDVTLRFFEGQGHGLTLERGAPDVRRAASEWLAARGF